MAKDIGFQADRQTLTCCGEDMRCCGEWPLSNSRFVYLGFSCRRCEAYIKIIETQKKMDWNSDYSEGEIKVA